MIPAKKKQRLSNGSALAVEPFENTADLGHNTVGETAAQDQEKAVQQRRSLFVRSLPSNATSESLTELFSDSFPVKHAVAVTDPSTKECRGYGFVTFADAEDAVRAKQQFNGHVLEGKKLRVEIAEPRSRNNQNETEENGKTLQEKQQHAPKLIVRNLPWSIKKPEQLSKLFMSYGKIKQAYIPKKAPGLMAGFGFVIMRGKKNAEKAIEGVNGKEVDGRTLAVDWAVEKNVYQDAGDHLSEEETQEKANTEEELHNNTERTDESQEGALEEEDDEELGSDIAKDTSDLDIEGDHTEDEMDTPVRFSEDRSSTLFIRNLPFNCTDEDLEDHFTQFGSTRYARVVMDHETARSKGTGFVCFYSKDDADACLHSAPVRTAAPGQNKNGKDGKTVQPINSILQNEYADPTGNYTLDGRVLQVSKAVDKSEATRLTEEGAAHRNKRDNDKRRLFLLSEGTISSKSKLWEELSPSERAMREQSAKQRKSLIESNPSLHLSLVRLSVRNIPRNIGSKELKQLAREAVVGFAKDVKESLRQKLSPEELSRGGEDMQAAETLRKKAGKGIVKQAKVVFESAGGSKVSEETGAGRSRGYGFIEYYTHRSALMGLRWLNGHAVDYQVKDGKGKLSKEDVQDRKKRLIVEFAIENAQVVMRRKESEQKAKTRGQTAAQSASSGTEDKRTTRSKTKPGAEKPASRKRKRGSDAQPADGAEKSDKAKGAAKKPIEEKLARRNQIIGRKRAMRARRKGGGKS